MSLFTFGQNFGNILSNATNNSNIMANNSDTIDLTANRNEVVEIGPSDEEDERDDDDDSYMAFRAKIPRLNSDSNLKESKNDKENENDDAGDEETCSICLEPWTNSGIHRLVCLKCGHLFGEGCIERWLKTNPKCPQCNRPSKRSDIRRIYARALKVIDTAELDKALKDLEDERQLRKKCEIETSEIKLRFQIVRDELSILQQKYNILQEKYNSGNFEGSSSNFQKSILSNDCSNSMSFNLEKMIQLTDNVNGGCRVLSFSARNLAILASQPSNTPMFPGFGIKKINFLDYKLSQYVPIHSKLIRDMSLCTQYDDETLLTCSLDKTIKLTNITSNRPIHSYECAHPIWSCCFNLENPFYFYAGLANGQVLLFDRRKIDTHVQILNSDQNTFSPVCNLNYVPRNDNFRKPGVLISQLDKVSFYETQSSCEEYKCHSLLLESNIMSCSLEPSSGHILVSTRPTQKHPNVRHLVYELLKSNNTESENAYALNHIQTYKGSNIQKMLARSKLFCFNSQLYATVPCEASKSAVVWNVSTGETCCKLNNQNDILDICPFQYKDQSYVSTLTDKQLRIFRKN
ncbi:unnamed protein product [Brachionus calyciflorus]|uniref:RING-type E3 ubiquitin transferase n=1 Tax=Brachionus calyciflorus TaxID=104777 RepID=A0A813Y3E3_9BILA|nr:unnamed protein product [Brachionus calyciflorus]